MRFLTFMGFLRGGCVAWLGSGPARGLVGLSACVASSTPGLFAAIWATANRPAAPPHATSPSSGARAFGRFPPCALTGRWRCARAQAPFAVAHAVANRPGVDAAVSADQPLRPRGGPENAHVATGLARGQRTKCVESKNLRPTRRPAEATRCSAQPPAPAPPTVPRETPTRRPAAQPARPPGVCPSSPSTPRPASRLTTTRR